MNHAPPSRLGRSAAWTALVLAGVLGGLALRQAGRDLSTASASLIAAALQRPPGAVRVAEARVHPLGEIRLRGVAVDLPQGTLRAGHVVVHLDPERPWTGARPRVRRLWATDVGGRYGPLLLAAAQATLHAGGDTPPRLVAQGVRVQASAPWLSGGPVLEIDRLSTELVRGQPQRLAASGVRLVLGGQALGPGEALLVREGPAVRFRAATAGGLIAGHTDGHEAAAELEMTRLRLALPFGPALDLSSTRASGKIGLRLVGVEGLSRGEGAITVKGRVALDDLALQHPLLSAQPLAGLQLALEGELTLSRSADGLHLRTEGLGLQRGPARLGLTADLRLLPSGEYQIDLGIVLDPIGCAELLQALPRPLLPKLEGLGVSGQIAGRARLVARSPALPEVDLTTELDLSCRVVSDAPNADPHSLLDERLSIERPGEDGRLRRLPLGSEAAGAEAEPGFYPLGRLPWPVVRVFLVAEDNQFYQHHGFDQQMIARALGTDLLERQTSRGASTISQQLVKNLWLRQERALSRKLEEAVLTWRLEQVVGKDRLLEIYLNMVELGSGIYGIGMAAQHYFGVPAHRLTLDQAARLAALLPAPRRGMDAAWARRYYDVLHRYGTAPVPHPHHGARPSHGGEPKDR